MKCVIVIMIIIIIRHEKIIKGQILKSQKIGKGEDKKMDQQKRTEEWKKKILHGQYPAAVEVHAEC